MRYAIENANGQWWTGTCWGAVQARQEYYSVRQVPDTLKDAGKLWIGDERSETLDMCYGYEYDTEILARVVVI